MGDLFDRFSGPAGPLSNHTADSGDTWADPSATCSISGAGAVYTSGTFVEGSLALSSWTPPGTDYSASFVVGEDFVTQPGSVISISMRVTGSPGAESYYVLQLYNNSGVMLLAKYRFNNGAVTGLADDTPVMINTNDVFTLSVAGAGGTVTLTAFQNGVQVASLDDTAADRVTSAGGVGLRIAPVAGHNDQIRAVWAGAIGGPAAGITPQSMALTTGAKASFSAVGVLPNDTPQWTVGSGTVDPIAGSITTYNAPIAGSTDTVAWTSANLPTQTAVAPVTLTPPAPIPSPPTPTPAPAPRSARGRASRRRRFRALLDFPLPQKEND
jgi:hypothetical protein